MKFFFKSFLKDKIPNNEKNKKAYTWFEEKIIKSLVNCGWVLQSLYKKQPKILPG